MEHLLFPLLLLPSLRWVLRRVRGVGIPVRPAMSGHESPSRWKWGIDVVAIWIGAGA
jgi:hypothetical protein